MFVSSSNIASSWNDDGRGGKEVEVEAGSGLKSAGSVGGCWWCWWWWDDVVEEEDEDEDED